MKPVQILVSRSLTKFAMVLLCLLPPVTHASVTLSCGENTVKLPDGEGSKPSVNGVPADEWKETDEHFFLAFKPYGEKCYAPHFSTMYLAMRSTSSTFYLFSAHIEIAFGESRMLSFAEHQGYGGAKIRTEYGTDFTYGLLTQRGALNAVCGFEVIRLDRSNGEAEYLPPVKVYERSNPAFEAPKRWESADGSPRNAPDLLGISQETVLAPPHAELPSGASNSEFFWKELDRRKIAERPRIHSSIGWKFSKNALILRHGSLPRTYFNKTGDVINCEVKKAVDKLF